MLNGCGMNTWTTNSVIRHAVADRPEGPYTPKEVRAMGSTLASHYKKKSLRGDVGTTTGNGLEYWSRV